MSSLITKVAMWFIGRYITPKNVETVLLAFIKLLKKLASETKFTTIDDAIVGSVENALKKALED